MDADASAEDTGESLVWAVTLEMDVFEKIAEVLPVEETWRDSVEAKRIECEAGLLREELTDADAH